MAEGAIEGEAAQYEVASRYATDFQFSRFDAMPLEAIAPRLPPPHSTIRSPNHIYLASVAMMMTANLTRARCQSRRSWSGARLHRPSMTWRTDPRGAPMPATFNWSGRLNDVLGGGSVVCVPSSHFRCVTVGSCRALAR